MALIKPRVSQINTKRHESGKELWGRGGWSEIKGEVGVRVREIRMHYTHVGNCQRIHKN